jgi:hypothetical protein
MPLYSCFNNNMHDYHHSNRRSLIEKKRKKSDLIFDEKNKHRRSSSYIHQKISKSQFDDARLFCDDCKKFYENICPYHKQFYIPDRKVG